MSRFYKIIFPSTIEDKNLRIPELFVRNYGNKISDPAKILLPDGRLWLLGITKGDKDIRFQDGFDEFLQNYLIRERHLLVFTYKGNSNFHVRIFDASSCEIQYPQYGLSSSENVQDLGLDELEMEDDDCVEYSEDDDCVESSEEDESVEKSNKKKACTSLRKPGRSCPGKGKANDGNEMELNYEKEETRTSGSIKRAHQYMLNDIYTDYRPENVSFMIQLSDYNIRKMGYMPIRFARKHVSRGTKTLKVKDLSGEKEWHIGILWRQSENKDAYLYKGWHQFLEGNQLKAGDVCGFELMKSTDEGVVLQFTKVHSA